jgi:hypothetical protein
VGRVSEEPLDLERLGGSLRLIRPGQAASDRPPLTTEGGRVRPSSAPRLGVRGPDVRLAAVRSSEVVFNTPGATDSAGRKGKGGGAGSVQNNPDSSAPMKRPQEYSLTPSGAPVGRKPGEEPYAWGVLSTRLVKRKSQTGRDTLSEGGAPEAARRDLRSTRSEGGASSYSLSRLSTFNVKLREAAGHNAFPQVLWAALQELYEDVDPLAESDQGFEERWHHLGLHLDSEGWYAHLVDLAYQLESATRSSSWTILIMWMPRRRTSPLKNGSGRG